MNIVMTEHRYERKRGFKKAYSLTKSKTEQITEKQYRNITDSDTLKWFRRLGGSETAQRNYTSAGYLITKLISSSPDRWIKVVREFEFLD